MTILLKYFHKTDDGEYFLIYSMKISITVLSILEKHTRSKEISKSKSIMNIDGATLHKSQAN